MAWHLLRGRIYVRTAKNAIIAVFAGNLGICLLASHILLKPGPFLTGWTPTSLKGWHRCWLNFVIGRDGCSFWVSAAALAIAAMRSMIFARLRVSSRTLPQTTYPSLRRGPMMRAGRQC